jgi:hypothetical protein
MFRLLKLIALALLVSVVAANRVSATTIMDPIVRTRSGAGGSIRITGLPFSLDWGSFPTPPPDTPGDDEDDCFNGPMESGMFVVTCHFLNQTGQTINFLNFDFDYSGTDSGEPPPLGSFFAQDGTPGDGNAIGWNIRAINQFNAQFIGNGIDPEICPEGCFGGHFFVGLIGFPDGTRVTMTALAEPVPEPMTLTLLATGLALGAGARHRRGK